MEGKKLNTLSCDPAIPSPAIYSELKKKNTCRNKILYMTY
jgi:hypothetical protein